jgi:hypothetical protein
MFPGFQDLVVATFGSSMAIITCVTILAFLVGSLISYFIITGVISCSQILQFVVYVG